MGLIRFLLSILDFVRLQTQLDNSRHELFTIMQFPFYKKKFFYIIQEGKILRVLSY